MTLREKDEVPRHLLKSFKVDVAGLDIPTSKISLNPFG